MKALIYDPYVDTLGGGERYVFTFALALQKAGYSVDLAWKDESIIDQARHRFDLDLSSVKIDPGAYHDLSLSAGLLARYRRTQKYDLVFWVSDGSLPYLFGRKNFIHFQVPFAKVGGNPANNFFKMLRVNRLIFNSNFTAAVIKRQLPLFRSVTLYPPIDTEGFKPGKKENLILSVARFDSPSHAKRQDVLIEAFRKLYAQNKNYQLVFAGAVKGEGGEDYLDSLKQTVGKLPIRFVVSPDFDKLKQLYAKAKIFWHAAGYGIDETKQPEKVEHFGITTVEAMAAGVVPVVIDKGGQREIITGDTGFLCQSTDEIVASTVSLLNSPEKLKVMSENATQRSREFNTERFIKEINATIGERHD